MRDTSLSIPSVSLVIPTFNAERDLPYILRNIPDYIGEVIIVDGRSTDNTLGVAHELRPDARIVLQKHKGKGAALWAGFRAARGEIIVKIDADGSMDAHESLTYIAALMNGAHYVTGSRFIQGGRATNMPLYVRVGHLVLNAMARLLFGGHLSDVGYGYIAFWKHKLAEMNLESDGPVVDTLLTLRVLRAGLRVAELPSAEARRTRQAGRAYSLRSGLNVLRAVLRERFKRPAFGSVR